MDHMSGLSDLANDFDIINFWDTDNDKEIGDGDWDNTPYDKDDWDCYQELRVCEENPNCLYWFRGNEKDGLQSYPHRKNCKNMLTKLVTIITPVM